MNKLTNNPVSSANKGIFMETKINTYEGMFLLDAGKPNFEDYKTAIMYVLDRAGAELVSMKPWEERKLAYEIEGRKRGMYVLTYFKLDTQKMDKLERDCQLSDDIIRALFLRKDALSEEIINAETPATNPAKPAESEEAETKEAPAEAKKEQAPAEKTTEEASE